MPLYKKRVTRNYNDSPFKASYLEEVVKDTVDDADWLDDSQDLIEDDEDEDEDDEDDEDEEDEEYEVRMSGGKAVPSFQHLSHIFFIFSSETPLRNPILYRV